jgi:glucose/arabinose dehydrogenase
MSKYRLPGVVAAAVAVVGVSSVAASAAGLRDPIPAPIRPAGIDIGLETVARGLESPVAATTAPGDRDHLFVADQNGKIWGITVRGHDDDDGDDDGDGDHGDHGDRRDRDDGGDHGDHDGDAQRTRWLVADLSGLLVDDLAQVVPGLAYDERGLLGLAFDPHFRHNGLLYTFTSENPTAPADFTTQPGVAPGGGQAVVTEWRVQRRHAEHIRVDVGSRRVLMRIDKPQFNHNGGDLQFGPGGMLFISVGDGGNADDQGPGHVPGGNAQSLAPGNVLGKVLRINPHGHSSANGQYGIPARNPFVGRAGADEIWAYGFRNPYRFSVDPHHARLIVGDVGQNDIEEVDHVRRGGNYGWPVKEGTFLFDNEGDAPGSVTANSPGAPAGLLDPVTQYDHTAPGGVRCEGGSPPSSCQGIAVVGGFVAQNGGDDLEGRYVFGDYSRAFAQPLGRLFVREGSTVRSLRDPGIAVFGFGQDHHGDLYVLGNKTGVLSGNTGVVLRITGSDDDD